MSDTIDHFTDAFENFLYGNDDCEEYEEKIIEELEKCNIKKKKKSIIIRQNRHYVKNNN